MYQRRVGKYQENVIKCKTNGMTTITISITMNYHIIGFREGGSPPNPPQSSPSFLHALAHKRERQALEARVVGDGAQNVLGDDEGRLDVGPGLLVVFLSQGHGTRSPIEMKLPLRCLR